MNLQNYEKLVNFKSLTNIEKEMFTRKLIIVQIFLFILASKGFGQVLKEDLKKDLLDYKKILSKYYLAYSGAEKDFDSKVSKLLDAQKDTLSSEELIRTFYEVNSIFKDMHLSVSAPISKENKKYIPFLISRFDNEFYVSYNQSKDNTWIRGNKILAINEKPVAQVFDEISDLVYTDGNKKESKEYYAEMRFGSLYHLFFSDSDSIKIKYSIRDTISEKKIPLLSQNEIGAITQRRYPNALRKNLKLNSLDSLKKIQILDLVSFSNKKGFKKQLKERFKTLKSDSTEALILDLRGNGGGAISNMQHLLSYISFSPYRLYDSIYISKPSLQKIAKTIGYLPARIFLKKQENQILYRDYIGKSRVFKPKKKYHFDGKLYVLTNPGTYSASSFTVSLLKNQNRAVFIGENVGGANWGSYAGMFLKQKLPRTNIKVRVPLMKLVHNTQGLNHSNFVVLPDYYVSQGFEDFIEREDSVIKFTKNLILNMQ